MRIRLGLALLLVSATPAMAQSYVTFQSPSGNIGCMIYDNQLRCDIMELTHSYAHPADCEQDFGFAFVLDPYGPGYPICAGDTVMDPQAPVIGYGQSYDFGPFTCHSDQSGMTCTNLDGGGIFLSRASQAAY